MAISKFKDRNLEKDTLLNIEILQNISSSSFRRAFPKEKQSRSRMRKKFSIVYWWVSFKLVSVFSTNYFLVQTSLDSKKRYFR